jgi:hypothetical protein
LRSLRTRGRSRPAVARAAPSPGTWGDDWRDPPPAGQQDVPLPGTEPYDDSINGPPLPAPPIDFAFVAQQEAYVQRLREQRQDWLASSLSDEQIIVRTAELKRQMLGDDR